MQERTWFTGAHMKWLAIVSMLIDHVGAVLLEHILLAGFASSDAFSTVYTIYKVMRGIGRFAFPVFCFLLVEGFVHTSNRTKYLRNLVVFAIISEIPFDWAIFGTPVYWGYQNVFWTLAAGFIAIWIAEYFQREALLHAANAPSCYVLMVLNIVSIAALTEVLHTDYGAIGVATIVTLYFLRRKPVMAACISWLLLTMFNSMEGYALPFVAAVYFYNGRRGKQAKYFFYAFYPLHLLILAVVRLMIF